MSDSFFTSVVAGTSGGIAMTIVSHPLDTMKIYIANGLVPGGSTSMKSAAKHIIATGGPMKFYAGVGSNLSGQGFLNSVLFAAENEGQRLTAGLPFGRSFASGFLAGAAAALIENSVDFFKTQAQVSTTGEGVFSLARRLVSERGVGVAFTGIGPTMMRNSAGYGSYFLAFDVLTTRLGTTTTITTTDPKSGQTTTKTKKSCSFLATLFAGGASGLAFWTLTYPVDVVKSAIQGDSADPRKRKYKGTMQTASLLFKEGGSARFFRGVAPCLLRSVPANATCFSVVTLVKQAMHVPSGAGEDMIEPV